MRTRLFFILFLIFTIFILFPGVVVKAQADLSITDASISFSEENFLADNMIRIYVRVWNTSDTDAQGFVKIYLNDTQIGSAQPISLKSGTYDDIFLDWLANAGFYNIKAELTDVLPEDIDMGNNIVLIENLFVDLDTDQDKIGNTEDLDDDNDGLSDQEEIERGTNPLQSDTDNDGVSDANDVFPLDPTEWSNNDGDNLGDNADLDDDNDGLSDQDEALIGTDPFNHDTDRDGVKDSLDVFPLDPQEWADSDGDGLGDNSDPEDNRKEIKNILELSQKLDTSLIKEESTSFDYFENEQEELSFREDDNLFLLEPSLEDNKPNAKMKIFLSIIISLLALTMLYAILKITKNNKRF